MLSSEILENQFGPTHVEVLYGGANMINRIIQTVANDSRQILELSWVKFSVSSVNAFPEIHQQIIADKKSMGKAYVDAGIPFDRDTATTSTLRLPSSFNRRFKVEGLSTIVEVAALVGHNAIHYCDILETYSPAVDWPDPPTPAPPSIPARVNRFSELIATLT